jgi:hypothetical protein
MPYYKQCKLATAFSMYTASQARWLSGILQVRAFCCLPLVFHCDFDTSPTLQHATACMHCVRDQLFSIDKGSAMPNWHKPYYLLLFGCSVLSTWLHICFKQLTKMMLCNMMTTTIYQSSILHTSRLINTIVV